MIGQSIIYRREHASSDSCLPFFLCAVMALFCARGLGNA